MGFLKYCRICKAYECANFLLFFSKPTICCLQMLFSSLLLFVAETVSAWSLILDDRVPVGLIEIHFVPDSPMDARGVTLYVNPSTSSQFQLFQAGDLISVNQVPVDIYWVQEMVQHHQALESKPGVIVSPLLIPNPVLPKPPLVSTQGATVVVPLAFHQQQLGTMSNHVSFLQVQVQHMVSQLSSLLQDGPMMSLKTHREILAAQQNNIHAQADEKYRLIEDLRQRIQELEAQLTDSTVEPSAEGDSQHPMQDDDHTKQIEIEIEQLRVDLQAAEAALEESQQKRAELEKLLSEKQSEAAGLQQKFQKQQLRLKQLDADVKRALRQAEAADCSAEDAWAILSKREREMVQIKHSLQQSEASCREGDQLLNEQKKVAAELSADLHRKSEEVEELARKLEQSERDAKQLEEEKNGLAAINRNHEEQHLKVIERLENKHSSEKGKALSDLEKRNKIKVNRLLETIAQLKANGRKPTSLDVSVQTEDAVGSFQSDLLGSVAIGRQALASDVEGFGGGAILKCSQLPEYSGSSVRKKKPRIPPNRFGKKHRGLLGQFALTNWCSPNYLQKITGFLWSVVPVVLISASVATGHLILIYLAKNDSQGTAGEAGDTLAGTSTEQLQQSLSLETGLVLSSGGCEPLSNHPLEAVCNELLKRSEIDFENALLVLVSMSDVYSASLGYAILVWWQRNSTVSRSLAFATVVDLLKNGDMGRNISVKELHLQSSIEIDFYQLSVPVQASVISKLITLLSDKSAMILMDADWLANLPYMEGLLRLALGIAHFAYILDHVNAELPALLEDSGIDRVSEKLSSLLFSKNGQSQGELNQRYKSVKSRLSIFELHHRAVFAIGGLTFRDEQVFDSGKKTRVIDCGAISLGSLKLYCYHMLAEEINWRAAALASLAPVLEGGIPVQKLQNGVFLKAVYPVHSEKILHETVESLLGWIEMYHPEENDLTKGRWVRSALVLAGVAEQNDGGHYNSLLEVIWDEVVGQAFFTGGKWSRRLAMMNGKGSKSHKDVTLSPAWKLEQGRWKLILAPRLPEIDSAVERISTTMSVNIASDILRDMHVYLWEPKTLEWINLNDNECFFIPESTNEVAITVSCEEIYGLGRSTREIKHYLGLKPVPTGTLPCTPCMPYYEQNL